MRLNGVCKTYALTRHTSILCHEILDIQNIFNQKTYSFEGISTIVYQFCVKKLSAFIIR